MCDLSNLLDGDCGGLNSLTFRQLQVLDCDIGDIFRWFKWFGLWSELFSCQMAIWAGLFMTDLLQVTGVIFPPQVDDFFMVEGQWQVVFPPLILITFYRSRGIMLAGASRHVV